MPLYNTNPTENAVSRDGLAELGRLTETLELDGPARSRAIELYREVLESESDLLFGRGVKAVTAACVHLASREIDDPKSAADIAEHTDDHVGANTILRASKALRSELGLGMLLPNPHTYVDRIADAVDAADGDRRFAHRVVDVVVEDGVASGHKSSVVAGASFYLAGNVDGGHGKYRQSEVAAAADITTVAIWKNYREFAKVITESPDNDIDVPFVTDLDS